MKRFGPPALLQPFRSVFALRCAPITLLLCLLLSGCNEFESAAYRTLAVTQAEYETVQRHVAEAAAHGLITEEQWNQFAVQGHRFIAAHNAAVDAFELWSRAKNEANEARVEALLEILPRLIRELNRLVESFESEPQNREAARSGPGLEGKRTSSQTWNRDGRIAEATWH